MHQQQQEKTIVDDTKNKEQIVKQFTMSQMRGVA
jgi:hypothetical protein